MLVPIDCNKLCIHNVIPRQYKEICWKTLQDRILKNRKSKKKKKSLSLSIWVPLQSHRRNGVVLITNKRVQNAVLGCNLKNRMISVCFQGKPFNITVIQVYAPTTNAEEAEVDQFYVDLKDLIELISTKNVLFIIGNWNSNVGSQEIPGVTGKLLGKALKYKMKQGKG